MMKRLLVTLLMLTALSTGVLTTQAQDNIVLTVEVPPYRGDGYDSAYFDAFRTAHPGVDVVVIQQDQEKSYPPSPAWNSLDEHLNSVSEYVASADVLFVSLDTFLTQESTRAGYWRDLKPLVLADPDLAEANFYPAAWRAYQWDGGMWALPIALRLNVLTYDPTAFDKAGLTYPDEHWGLDNFITAATTLTERDKNGVPTKPGCICDDGLIFNSLLGGGLKDANDSPQLDSPELATLMDKWSPISAQIYPPNGYSSEGVPIQMSGVYGLTLNTQDPMVSAQMPGKITSAYLEGFGVSAGSIHPEMAFELVKFLAQNPRNTFGIPGQFPSLRTANPSGSENINTFSPENQTFIDAALDNALGGADFLFFNYVYAAENNMRTNHVDGHTALQDAQAKALANLEAASQWTGAQNLMVATSAPTPSFGVDEIILHFGISQQEVKNPKDWERVAQAFAASDPQVGQVAVDYQGMDYQGFIDNNDCYYLTYDGADAYRIPDYINLDPYTNADPDFIPSDFLPGALDAMQVNGKIWGYPLSMQVVALMYDPANFQKAGVPLPGAVWTINDFADAVQAFQNADLGIAAFTPRNYAPGDDFLMLIAAYGGLPIDYRTDPPTINFTKPDTVSAVRQVLDLAKSGTIRYTKLGTFSFTDTSGGGVLNPVQMDGSNLSLKGYNSVNFPQNSAYSTMLVGDVGGMFISKHAQNPDACYRWMATVAAHPELLPGVMPARAAAINDPVLLAAQGENAVSLDQEFAHLLTAPNTVIFHSGMGGGGVYSVEMFYIYQWLGRAFDAYVLDIADLDTVLADAQSKADDFVSCVNKIPALSADAGEAEMSAYYDGLAACMKLADPAMAAEQEALSSGTR
ncbi:MAG: hypothetical protein ABI690_25200 [Chloroflexota bacterium]